MKLLSQLSQGDLRGKRVLVRADFNVPISEGVITDDTRIRATIPTIQHILTAGGSVILCSHLGRPDGMPNKKYSLAPVAKRLSELLHKEVVFLPNPLEEKSSLGREGEVVLLENTRFFAEEEANSPLFSALLANGCDLYVNDAFGAAHRAHASTAGVADFLSGYSGLLLEKEVNALSGVMKDPDHPLILVLGGAKMKTKIGVLRSFIKSADSILLGGGIANTFLAASGVNVQESLYEEKEIETAKEILDQATKNMCSILLPIDAVVAKNTEDAQHHRISLVQELSLGEKIFDIGPESQRKFSEKICSAKTILWNGPVGLSEVSPFEVGTRAIANAMTESSAKVILGGGDTLEAIARLGFSEDQFFHISTGGGAMLELLEGKELPGVMAVS
ncbi:phosphoglycerate kinase [Candidatus Peregrinibacteria bacterium]|nr:MAG: phosphoglycerate kinase [Candidatus Peregrinibacteria bacterium]